MSYAPATILDLRAYLAQKTRLSPAALGIVGDAAHQRRASYHNGQDAIQRYGRTAANDYSIRTARDREPFLTNAASALDIGNFDRLRSLSMSLVAQARAGLAGTADIREIIYSPDGIRVLRWDRQRGRTSMPVPMADTPANNTHRWHTHVSWYRDSERRNKLAPFRHYFEPTIVTGPIWGHDVAGDIVRAYKPTTVAAKLKALGGDAARFGSAINNVDLEAGLRARNMTWGTTVNLIDVRKLMSPGLS